MFGQTRSRAGEGSWQGSRKRVWERTLERTGERTVPETGETLKEAGETIEEAKESVQQTGEAIPEAGEVIKKMRAAARETGEPVKEAGEILKETNRDRPKAARDWSLDIMKGLLVMQMVLCHCIQFFGNESWPVQKELCEYINLTTFPGFLFTFGAACQYAYFSKKFTQAAPRMLKDALKMLIAFYLSGICYIAFVEYDYYDPRVVPQLLTLQKYPGWSEFLASFFGVLLVAILLFGIFKRINLLILAVIGLISWRCTFLPYERITHPWLALFVGSTNYLTFPVLQYLFYFASGAWICKTMAAGKGGGKDTRKGTGKGMGKAPGNGTGKSVGKGEETGEDESKYVGESKGAEESKVEGNDKRNGVNTAEAVGQTAREQTAKERVEISVSGPRLKEKVLNTVSSKKGWLIVLAAVLLSIPGLRHYARVRELSMRFPPDAAFVFGASMFVCLYYYLSRFLAARPARIRILSVIGENALFFLLFTNCVIFAFAGSRFKLRGFSFALLFYVLLMLSAWFVLHTVRRR